jgi:hypothetical protein
MVTLLAVAAGFGQIDPEEAWRIHETIETVRRRSILLPTHKDVFKAAAETFSKLEGKIEPWPNVLSRANARRPHRAGTQATMIRR